MAFRTEKALRRHLWYLSESLVPLALFSKNLSESDKSLLALKILSTSNINIVKITPRPETNLNLKSHLSAFVTHKSRFTVITLYILDILQYPVNEWSSHEFFRRAD
ncbi:hypothetical protein A3Q56_07495, partial [Intoshia linei]